VRTAVVWTLNLAGHHAHKVQSPTSHHQQPHTGSNRTQITSASLMQSHSCQTCAEAWHRIEWLTASKAVFGKSCRRIFTKYYGSVKYVEFGDDLEPCPRSKSEFRIRILHSLQIFSRLSLSRFFLAPLSRDVVVKRPKLCSL